MNLRARLCLLVGLAAVPLLGLETYQQWSVARTRMAEAREDALRWARLEAADQKRVVDGVRQLLAALAQVPAVRNLDTEGCTPIAIDIERQFPQFVLVAAVDDRGFIVCSSRETSGMVSFSDRAHFKGVMASGDFFVGEYILGRVSGQPVLPFGYPLRDEAGKVRGMVLVAMRVDWLIEVAREKPLPPRAVLMVIDRHGTLMVRLPEPGSWVGQPVAGPLHAMLAANVPGITEGIGPDGTQRVFGFVPVGSTADGLFVSVGIDEMAILADLRHDLLGGVGLTLLGILAAAAIAWSGGGALIARPVASLVNAAQHWRAGDRETRSRVRGGEFGEIGTAFDAMADAIAAREGDLREAKDAAERAADALRQSEARLLLAQEAAGVGIWEYELATGLLRYSPQQYRHYAITAEEFPVVPYESWLDRIVAEDRALADEKVRAAIATGDEYVNEFRIRRDGELRWIAARGSVLRDESGGVIGMVGANLDVTERKSREAELQRLNLELERRVLERTGALSLSEARYRLIAENAHDLITRTSAGNVRLYASPGSRLVLGYAPEELTGAPSRGLIHAEDQHIVIDAARALRERRASERVVQYRARHKAGHWVWIESAQRLVDDPADPECLDIVSVMRDVSERRRLEEELRASEARSAAFFQYTTAGIIMVAVKPDGRFIYEAVNPAHCQSTGFVKEEFEGRTPQQLFVAEVAERIAERYRRCVETGESLAFEDAYDFPVGRRVEQVTLRPIRDAAGRVERILVSVHDITEQKAAEEQLRQAQKMEAVGQLTGGVAHDFNNLLTAVIGNLEMAASRAGEASPIAPFLKNALGAAERGAGLTQRLLAFARKQHLSPKPVDVTHLVTGVEDLLQRTLGPAIRLHVEPQPELWPALIDPHQLELAILNLSINARDAMLTGGALRIMLANRRAAAGEASPAELAAGDYVVVTVIDSGTGMDDATLTRVFEPFFTTKDVGKGSGLGLPMVQGFAAQSGGTVRIRSRLGRGTTVEIWLPRAPSPAAAEAKSAVEERPAPRSLARLLICDDDADVRRFIGEFLRASGYSVHEANGPTGALRILDAGTEIDCMVVDFAMPEMNGVVLAREAQLRRPDLPVLLITGHAEALRAELAELPRLAKPFKPAVLAQRIAELLGGGGHGAKIVPFTTERRA